MQADAAIDFPALLTLLRQYRVLPIARCAAAVPPRWRRRWLPGWWRRQTPCHPARDRPGLQPAEPRTHGRPEPAHRTPWSSTSHCARASRSMPAGATWCCWHGQPRCRSHCRRPHPCVRAAARRRSRAHAATARPRIFTLCLEAELPHFHRRCTAPATCPCRDVLGPHPGAAGRRQQRQTCLS